MGRPRKTKPGLPVNLGFRAPADLIQAVDAEAARMGAETKGMRISRTQAVQVLLWEAIASRAKARGE
jgi:hypothetical protein